MKTCLLLILLAATAVAQQPPAKADANPQAETEIKNFEMDSAKILVKGDWDQYSSTLSDDFVRTGRDGSMAGKKQVLEEFRSSDKKLLDVIPEELAIRVYGDAAVVTGHLSTLVRENGKVITTFARFTDLLIHRDGRWVLAATQETAVKK